MDGNVSTAWRWPTRSSRRSPRPAPNPTRQDLVDTLEKGGLTGPGLVPFRFSADSHAGYTGVQIGKIDGRRLRARGHSRPTTDDGKGEITEYTEAPPDAPANGVPAVH